MDVFNPNTGRVEKIRAFLDGGAQMSIISTDCAKRCGLRTLKTEPFLISTFGKKPLKQNIHTTKIEFFENSEDFSGKFPLDIYVMDNLIDPIQSYQLSGRQNNYIREHDIVLADEEAGADGRLKVDILIGQDYINNFYKGHHIYLPGGSVLKPTFGNKYILAGTLDQTQVGQESSHFRAPNIIMINCATTSVKNLQNMGFSKRVSSLIKNVYSCISSEEELEVIETFRTLELLGISPLDYKISPILENFNDTTVFHGGRYWVKLPFNDKKKSLSNNFFQAFSRLMSGVKRRQKPKYFEEAEKYEKSFKDELDLDILERVETLGTIHEVCEKLASNPQFFNQIKLPNGRQACYLPHQAVYKASTGKFRRVHDGSAKPYKGAVSINDVLEKGPNLTASILHILLGFRKSKFAIKADIEKAFPQVGISEEDRDVLRCLWIEDGKVVVYRFKRLPFGLSCSPFILQATLRLHLGENNVNEEVKEHFTAGTYVDDFLKGEDTVEKLIQSKHFYTNLFDKCGMHFRDWTSNNPLARAEFAQQESREPKIEEGALGMLWDTENDILRVNSQRLMEKIKNTIRTKRDLWKIIPSIYDPLGFLSPYVLLGKLIVANACREIKSWDSKLPQHYIDALLKWAREFSEIQNISWNRFAGIENPKRVQLYGCCDASSYALGACIYLVSTAQNGEITTNLLLSKTRNAPVNEHSIPRLELSSAVLLINLMAHARKVYKVDDSDVTWFTDSADVLFWIYSGHLSWKPFVANQIKKIRKCSEIQSWRHIDTKENPADLASRGETIKNLAKSNFWNSGPAFWKTGDLSLGASKVSGYSKHYENLEITENCAKEMQKEAKRQLDASASLGVKKLTVSSLMVNAVSILPGNKTLDSEDTVKSKLKIGLPRIDKAIDVSKLLDSSYDYLMRISEVWVNFSKFIVEKWQNKLLEKGKKVPQDFIKEKLTFCSKNNSVELMWVQAVQQKHFAEIFMLLENPKAKVSSFSRSLLSSHAIFLDKDMKVLRCTTRNEKSMISYSGVYPILLPSSVRTSEGGWEDCEFTKKLVLQRHHSLGHQGVPDTLSNIRDEFWILKGRSFVQRIIKNCITCKKVQGSRYSVPPSPSLPEFRVVRNKPFAGTGVDYLGPFKCRDSPRGKIYKAWYVSFVCGSTRAVHIEAVKSRKIDDFLLAMSRFMYSNGIPESFISDHEGSFKKCSEGFEQIVKSKRVQEYLKNKRISWNFYTEKSPNKGGFIERLNSNIKKTFYKSVGKKVTNFEVFRTVADQAGSLLNDRPLTYILSDINSEQKALTPSMLIRGYNTNEPPHMNLRKEKDKIETKLSDTYYLSEKIIDRFWRVWNKQYLKDLFERHVRQKRANKELVVPKVGEVCLISEDKLPRRQWRLGRVVSINEKRGSVREVVVQTLSPEGGLITKLKRSPDKLIPLSPDKVIPLEMGNETKSFDPSEKYTKKELSAFKKRKIFPPYKPSKQFLDPSSINTGPETDYVGKKGKNKDIENELPRIWKHAKCLFAVR